MHVVAAIVLLSQTSCTGALHTYPAEGILPDVTLSSRPGLPTLEQYLQKEANALQQAPGQIALAQHSSTADFSAEFRRNFQGFLGMQRFKEDQDVYVTIGDGSYSRYFEPWSRRLASLGLRQQVIVCLDDESASAATANNLPAVDHRGLVVSGERRKGLDIEPPPLGHLPLGLTVLKFLVPKILLEQNFQRVVFAEGDIYFFGNPSAYYPKHTPYASMDDGRLRSLNLTNIGFMVFSGQGMLKVISDFLGLWSREYANNRRVLQDQHVFQEVLKKHKQGQRQVFLDKVRFSLGPRQVRPGTAVAHFAFACAACKRFLLDELYERHPKAEAFMETVLSTKGMFPDPVEC